MGTFFRRIERLMARFNKWLAPAALAEGALQSGVPQQADAQRVAAILGEIESDSGGSSEKPESAA
jgi:hypothetical protein